MSKIVKQNIINLKNRLNQLYINLHQRNLYNDEVNEEKISIDSINKLIFYKNKIEEDGDFRPREIKQKFGVSKGEIIRKEVLDNIAYDLNQLEANKKEYKLKKSGEFQYYYWYDDRVNSVNDFKSKLGAFDGNYNYIQGFNFLKNWPSPGQTIISNDKKRKVYFRAKREKILFKRGYYTVDIYSYE